MIKRVQNLTGLEVTEVNIQVNDVICLKDNEPHIRQNRLQACQELEHATDKLAF